MSTCSDRRSDGERRFIERERSRSRSPRFRITTSSVVLSVALALVVVSALSIVLGSDQTQAMLVHVRPYLVAVVVVLSIWLYV